MKRSLAIGRVAKHFHRDHLSRAKIFSRFDDHDYAVDGYDDYSYDHDDNDDDDDDDHDHYGHGDNDTGSPQPSQTLFLF